MRPSRGASSADRKGGTALLALGLLLGCHRNALPPRPDGAAVVVAEDLHSDVPSVDEKEPNDALGTATPLVFGEAGGLTVKAMLEPGDGKSHGVDVYRLTVPPPSVLVAEARPSAQEATDGATPDGGAPLPRQRLTVTVDAHGGALVLEALDGRGNLLMSDGAAGDEAAGFPNWFVLPGVYHVRVRVPPVAKPSRAAPRAQAPGAGGAAGAVPSTTPYAMTLRLSTPEPGDEIEPNGKAAWAQTTTADDEVAGFLGWRRDEDWYRVEVAAVPEGNLLSLDLSPVPGVAASLAVFDLAEHRLLDRKGRKDEALSVRDLAWPKGEAAVYVAIRTEGGKNATERYRLRVRNQPVSPETETEPNDDPAHALPLVEGTVQGTLGRGDVDVYRFKVEEPRVASLEVTPPERVDVKVDVLRENGGAAIVHLDQGKRREPETLPNLFLVPGSYLLRLTTAPGDGNADEPYQLALTLRSPEAGEEREPNDAPSRATLLSPGVAARGWLAPRGDVDAWRFDHPAAKTGTLSIEGIPDLGFEVKVSTAAGREVAHASVGAGAREAVTVPAGPEGCCFIQIREKSGKLVNSRDSYGLTLTYP